ncbi:hypothetical protein FI667_g152, partial [Globisporangium splendens]
MGSPFPQNCYLECMGGGHHGASPSSAPLSGPQPPPPPSSLPAFIASLTSADVDALHRVFNERLCVDDLRVLMCTHCLLLTLSSSHRQEEQLELRVVPWELLRLELCTNAASVWQKLETKLRRLVRSDTRFVAPAQPRFVYQQLGGFYHEQGQQQQRVKGVSGCRQGACYSAALDILKQVQDEQESPTEILNQERPAKSHSVPHHGEQVISHVSPPRKKKSNKPVCLPRLASPPPPPSAGRDEPQTQQVKRVMRARLRLGDHYVLFQAVAHGGTGIDHASSHKERPRGLHRLSSGSSTTVTAANVASWAVYRLEANRNAAQWQRRLHHDDHYSAASRSAKNQDTHSKSEYWNSPHSLPWQLVEPLSPYLTRIPPLAFAMILFQFGAHAHVFDDHRHRMDLRTNLTLTSVPFLLKCAVLSLQQSSKSATCHEQLHKSVRMTLVGIGNATIPAHMAVAALRQKIQEAMQANNHVSAVHTLSGNDAFRFVYRGSLLPIPSETEMSAIALLPFVVVLKMDDPAYASSSSAGNACVDEVRLLYRKMARDIQQFDLEIAQALRNAGPPNHLHPFASDDHADSSAHAHIAYYKIAQEITTATACAMVLIEFFVNWSAFVHFQLLQDSTTVLQLSAPSDPAARKSKPRFKTEAQKIAAFVENQRQDLLLQRALRESKETQLPHHRFNPDCEYLKPVYATATVTSSLTAVLTSPFVGDILALLSPTSDFNNVNIRLVLLDADHLIHLTSVLVLDSTESTGCSSNANSIELLHSPCLQIEFQRDASYPAESLQLLCNARLPLCDASEDTVLHKKYDAMCKAHPPSFAIDGVKFSNFLRECGLQPTVLSIGDVAYLFARSVASGSHYEMDFGGFVQALESIASLVYPPVSPKKKKCANDRRHYRGQSNDDNEAGEGFVAAPSPPLASLVFERLLFVPSMAVIWYELITSWRLEKKLELLTVYAREYCAATRIRSVWKLAMSGDDRRIHARHQLRCLRAQRAAFVEVMRVRIVKWMRQRLRVLREWKKTNAMWVARRERIWTKRKRRICEHIYELETRRLRFTLYRGDTMSVAVAEQQIEKPILTSKCLEDNKHDDDISSSGISSSTELFYELEIFEAIVCWQRAVRIPHSLITRFLRQQEDVERNQPRDLRLSDSGRGLGDKVLEDLELLQRLTAATSELLSALVQRVYLHVRHSWPRISTSLRRDVDGEHVKYYKNPIYTSLGKLVFRGVVAVTDTILDSHRGSLYVVKMLQSSGYDVLKLIVYNPRTSMHTRWDLSIAFAFQILQFSRYRSMTLLPSGASRGSEAVDLGDDPRKKQEDDENEAARLRAYHILQDPIDKSLVVRHIVRYVLAYGLQPPEYDNMEEVVAERMRLQAENEQRAAQLRRTHEEELVVFAQTRVRRTLARRSTYRKQLNRPAGSGFVYVNLVSPHHWVYKGKPRSLLECDVADPIDEWLRVSDDGERESVTSLKKRFFNPPRDVFSAFNVERAELLYRRAIDLDPSNEMILENYRRLERERAPDGIYRFAGPGKIALRRAKNEQDLACRMTLACTIACQEIGRIGSTRRVTEDLATRNPNARCFYYNIETRSCTWDVPENQQPARS